MIEGDGILVSEGLQADGILVHAPPPLGTLWIPLSTGLTVLYGRNGAGKTRASLTRSRAPFGALRSPKDMCRCTSHRSTISEDSTTR